MERRKTIQAGKQKYKILQPLQLGKEGNRVRNKKELTKPKERIGDAMSA